MAELKNYVLALVATLFIATVAVSIYSTALTNNVASGGTSSPSFPLLNETQGYTDQMTNFSNDLAKATYAASSTQDWTTAFVGGIGAIVQAGTGAIALTFSSIKILIGMMSSLIPTLGMMGIPGFVIGFGILAIAVSIVFAILAALYKWWI